MRVAHQVDRPTVMKHLCTVLASLYTPPTNFFLQVIKGIKEKDETIKHNSTSYYIHNISTVDTITQ